MFYIVYKIIQLSTGREYIGQHQTDNLNDGYTGSGTLISPAVEENPSDFVKTILWYCDSYDEMNELEASLVTEEYLLKNFPEKTFNQVPGGKVDLPTINKWQKILYPGKTRIGRGANAGKIKIALGDKNIWIYPDKFDDSIHSRVLNKSNKPRKKETGKRAPRVRVKETSKRNISAEVQSVPDTIKNAFKVWKFKNKARLTTDIYDKWEQRILSKNPGLCSDDLLHLRGQVPVK